jgi:chromosome segregation protein
MYLEKLEIQGFKSFANKNLLVFPDPKEGKRGITVVVGPNGSGKSNIADSVRWALGEQSMKALRGKKSEDVIFSGSDKKGKLGMAEVSLFLNNEDKRAGIDFSEIVLTRRLFRNGDSEYLINNSKARLSDIQIMLAKANFGQKTYSVIGQGMVEGFLNTSLSERKEFFDEATGVKQFQIKRDDSLNKLRQSYENLNQAQLLVNEIEPRLKSLTRQVNKLKKRDELEEELKELQTNYYSKLWHEINGKFSGYNGKLLDLEKQKIEKEKKLELMNREHRQFEMKNDAVKDFDNWQRELSVLQAKKDQLIKNLAVLDAKSEVEMEKQGKFDLSWLVNRQKEITEFIKELSGQIDEYTKVIESEKRRLKEFEEKRKDTEQNLEKLRQRLKQAESSIDRKDISGLNSRLKNILEKIIILNDLADLDSIRLMVGEIRGEVEEISRISAKFSEQENIGLIRTDLLNFSEEKENLVQKINEAKFNIGIKEEQQKMAVSRKNSFSEEIQRVLSKLKEYDQGIDPAEIAEEKKRLNDSLKGFDLEIDKIKSKLENFSKAEDETRKNIFNLQRNMQGLQSEISALNKNISELKISSARYETRLEDLEAEIRQNFHDIKLIRDTEVTAEIEYDYALEKINGLKKQLDLIGGIDPEIEKEYIETKEKYDYLTGQIDDLMKAVDSLEKVIRELDITIKDKFDKEFKIISEKFEEYFKILFSGGKARIIKVMESELNAAKEDKEQSGEAEANPAEDKFKGLVDLKRIKFLQKYNATGLAGIEINATPPGKKIKTLAMLSGGERALTAIALICAIISANPSPFVVLDEVDAALDEANSERLAKILDDLSHKTQFIVVSHNRASMRKAQILYGVTMQEDGVSKLLSVKLEEAMDKNISNK